MNGINTSNYTYIKTDHGTFLDASKDIQKVSKDTVDVDSFVRVEHSSMRLLCSEGAAPSKYLQMAGSILPV